MASVADDNEKDKVEDKGTDTKQGEGKKVADAGPATDTDKKDEGSAEGKKVADAGPATDTDKKDEGSAEDKVEDKRKKGADAGPAAEGKTEANGAGKYICDSMTDGVAKGCEELGADDQKKLCGDGAAGASKGNPEKENEEFINKIIEIINKISKDKIAKAGENKELIKNIEAGTEDLKGKIREHVKGCKDDKCPTKQAGAAALEEGDMSSIVEAKTTDGMIKLNKALEDLKKVENKYKTGDTPNQDAATSQDANPEGTTKNGGSRRGGKRTRRKKKKRKKSRKKSVR